MFFWQSPCAYKQLLGQAEICYCGIPQCGLERDVKSFTCPGLLKAPEPCQRWTSNLHFSTDNSFLLTPNLQNKWFQGCKQTASILGKRAHKILKSTIPIRYSLFFDIDSNNITATTLYFRNVCLLWFSITALAPSIKLYISLMLIMHFFYWGMCIENNSGAILILNSWLINGKQDPLWSSSGPGKSQKIWVPSQALLS